MKPTMIKVLLLFLCMLQADVVAVGLDESTGKGKKSRWAKVGNDGQVLRLWKNEDIGPKWPQIAILRLSKAQFRYFTSTLENAKEFLNDNKIFDPKVIKVRFNNDDNIASRLLDDNDSFLVLVEHDQDVSDAWATFIGMFSKTSAKR